MEFDNLYKKINNFSNEFYKKLEEYNNYKSNFE